MRLWVSGLVALVALVSGHAFAAPSLNYHVTKTWPIGGEGGWDYLTFDQAGRRLYVSRFTRVQVIDVDSGTLAGEITNTPGVHGVAVAPRLHRGFTSNGGDNTVTVFDAWTLKELDRVTVGTHPDGIMFDPAVNRVFTFNGGSHDATAVEAATGKVAGTVPLGGKPEGAVWEGGLAFVNLEDKNEIAVFDAKSLAILNRWPLTPGDSPTGLALDAAHHRLFATCGNEKMMVLDSQTGRLVATVPIGKGPDAAAFDPHPGLAFAPNGRDGTLTVVQEETPDKFTVLQTVPTQASARTMAMDAKTHTIYLAAAKFKPRPPAPANAPRQRPELEPGSFVILAVGR